MYHSSGGPTSKYLVRCPIKNNTSYNTSTQLILPYKCLINFKFFRQLKYGVEKIVSKQSDLLCAACLEKKLVNKNLIPTYFTYITLLTIRVNTDITRVWNRRLRARTGSNNETRYIEGYLFTI